MRFDPLALALRTVRLLAGASWFCLRALALGFGELAQLLSALARGKSLPMRLIRALAPSLRCPRGHADEPFGGLQCANCHAVFQGFVWRACPVCCKAAGWIACATCGLAIRNPLMDS